VVSHLPPLFAVLAQRSGPLHPFPSRTPKLGSTGPVPGSSLDRSQGPRERSRGPRDRSGPGLASGLGKAAGRPAKKNFS
jgi:hypothetical protein